MQNALYPMLEKIFTYFSICISIEYRSFFIFRFTYQIVVAFNPNKIKPHEIDTYNSWEELNRFYGVVNINKDLGDKWKAIIEFQPGKYLTHRNPLIKPSFTWDWNMWEILPFLA